MTDRQLSRRAVLGGVAAAASLAGVSRHAGAQAAWPTRPVTVVVGFPPGGQTDFAARILQPGLQAALHQPIVVENRGGAGGNLGTEAVLRARPDGQMLLAGNANPLTINPHTFQNMTIDPQRLTPIGLMLQSALILCAHPSVPQGDMAALTAWMRAQPRGADYGSASAGSLSHVAMELFRNRLGNPPIEHVPYRGSGPAMQDFIAGRFSLMFDGASVVAPFLKAGQLRGVLVTSEKRIPAFPDIPTAAEAGVQDFIFTAWIGLFGPPGLPAEIVQKANGALNQALQDPQTRTRITDQGDEPGGGTPEQLGEMMRRDHQRWGEVVRANNIRAE
jgi:tripartite-type tricarboxylate transporter receptor subunit TctC